MLPETWDQYPCILEILGCKTQILFIYFNIQTDRHNQVYLTVTMPNTHICYMFQGVDKDLR